MNDKMHNIIKNIFIKFFLLFFIIAIILDEVNHKKDINNLKDYFSQSICKILYFTINYDCSLKLFTNNDFYEDIKEINSNIDLLINIKISKLESIFLLLGIIPFLKNNSTLSYKINNKEIYNFIKEVFKNKIKKINHKIIKLDFIDFNTFNEKMEELLNYKWELIPEKIILDNLRYIIDNYYNESNFDIFQKSLYMNYNLYIQLKKKEITFNNLVNLLSKCHYYYFIYKIENIGIYEKVKCVGRGTTGRVCFYF
jgi:hypothetical protein